MFDNYVEAYISNLKSNMSSPNTVESYSRTLRWFGNFLRERGYKEPSVEAVTEFKNELFERGLKITTLNLYMTHIRSFFQWAVECRFYEYNPCVKAIMPNAKRLAREKDRAYENILDEEEIKQILGQEEAPPRINRKTWPRDRAILAVFLTTGMRNTELCSLKLSDIDFINKVIRVRHGKGDKERFCGLSELAHKRIREYLQSGIRPKDIGANAPLFGIPSSSKDSSFHAFERIGMTRLVSSCVHAITGRDGIRSHALRHACASIMYDKGIPKDSIQELLGHSSSATTERYIERLHPTTSAENANKVFGELFAS